MFKLYTRAIIENENGEILLVKKNNKQKIAPGKVLPPGGTVEFGEEITDTLKREVEEETNLEITEIGEIVKTETIINGDTHGFGVYYKCKTKDLNFENMEPEKHKKVFWGEL
ncbi:hypothetical protein CSB08_00275 [Candidatus Gracilibacteria bacterium]|nr:MAG: hypothetical protein CSB08_00275 [Candidatus Gracilibacteria bacterium]PIE85279.1 MAG: hypothetical protein CSA08_02625 [Candidatus Gracilibacteria bacterium]